MEVNNTLVIITAIICLTIIIINLINKSEENSIKFNIEKEKVVNKNNNVEK